MGEELAVAETDDDGGPFLTATIFRSSAEICDANSPRTSSARSLEPVAFISFDEMRDDLRVFR
jgi:hypothetical protein